MRLTTAPADHSSVGPPARAGLPSGPERRALAAWMSKGSRRRRSFGWPKGWCSMACAPLPADPIPAAFGHAGGWRRSPGTAPRTSTGRWPSRRTSCPSAPSSARRPSSSQTRASTSSRSCRRRAALHTHRMGTGMGMGMGTAPALHPNTHCKDMACSICKDMAYACTAYTLHKKTLHVHCRSCRTASARSCLPRAGRRSRGAASHPRARPT